MLDNKRCPNCGAELPPDAPGGHCMNCLLQLGLSATEPAETPGDRIGHYKLLQRIGEGGYGVVYMAEQEEPVRRRVALKIIKLGMDTKQVIVRFEAERQALALMDHPNIAKVFDAGATETGRPYFVMELVRGVKITEYCNKQRFTTRQRLELFVQVCHAVQHAHQKGIIHRDIKPSNILVTEQDGRPVPKIIDFGIAKATTGQPLTDKTLFTAFEQFIGTPAYMSPEQAGLGKLDVDTRSDVYSLGVLLYELLTGRPPFDSEELRRAAIDEVLRTIRETEPPRPSSKLTTLSEQELTLTAQQRRIEKTKLSHILRGDLDWIAMKCLEKDRARRYETANGLARDVQRHLNDEPVVACPPSNLYRVRKLLSRHKTAVFTVILVAIALTTGLALAARGILEQYEAKREILRNASELASWCRKLAQRGDAQAQYAFGVMLIDGRGVEKNERAATEWLNKAADAGSSAARLQLAWLFATSNDPRIRSGSKAVRLAEKALAATQRKDPELLDILAAAYAETGQFDHAISIDENALLATENSNSRKEIASHLELFRHRKPLQERSSSSAVALNIERFLNPEVISIRGTVEMSPSGAQGWVLLGPNLPQPLVVNDRLRTGTNSNAVISTWDGGTIHVRELTSLILEPPDDTNTSSPVVHILRGGIGLRVRTTGAVAGIDE